MMYRNIPTTWLFYLLLPVILASLCLSAPAENPINGSETMYEVLVLKCPHLEKSELHENFKDIFDNKCTNWTAINGTKNPFSDGVTNAQCLVLYESVLSFCKSFGERLSRFKGLMPKITTLSSESVDKICNISSSLNNTEHNISDILTPVNCALMCGEVTGQAHIVIHNICKLSYFFGTFNINKFLDESKSLIAKTDTFNGSTPLNHTGLVSGVSKPNLTQAENKSAAAQNPQVETDEKLGEPEHPNSKLSPIQPAAGIAPSVDVEPSDINLVNQMPKNDNDIKAEILPNSKLLEKSGEPPKNQEPKNTNITSEKKVGPKSDIDTPVKSEPEEGQKKQKNPKTGEQSLGSHIEDDWENQANPNAVEEPENGGYGEEEGNSLQDKNEEIDEKAEPKKILDGEAEASPKVEKPATVEKEKVSSYTIPEDDMDGDSYFFSYFTVLMCLVVVAYVGYHNRQKILALVLEGKRGKRSGRQGRRPNSANYHKLGSNLEEAISSSCKKDTSNIIY